MFQIGDYVVSSANGICKIDGEIEQDWSGEKRLYFVLSPIREEGAKVYIPVENADQRVRKAMTRQDAQELINKLKATPELPIENEKFCEKEYKTAIYSQDPLQIVRMIKTIYARKQQRVAQGKKTTTVDDRYFKIAIHTLHSELAYAWDCREEEVEAKIIEAIETDYT